MALIQTVKYRIYPDQETKQILDERFDYRRYCWNAGLELWNDLYFARKLVLSPKLQAKLHEYGKLSAQKRKEFDDFTINDIYEMSLNPSPSEYRVRDMLTAEKAEWQYNYPAHLLNLAINDLSKAFKAFFDKSQTRQGLPHFKSKRDPKQSFKDDQARIKDGYLYLTKCSPIHLSGKILSNKFGTISIYKKKNKYYVSIPYKVDIKLTLPKTGKYTGIDLNVGHFDYIDDVKNVLPKQLKHHYNMIAYYQRLLARKRNTTGSNSKRYEKVRTKLNREYEIVSNLQHDLMHKFTTMIVKTYDTIVIEDLNVKAMLMSHVASKGVHKSLFGLFRQLLTYKCDWYGKKLIIANKLYPSTQRCYNCGYVKKGDEKITLHGNKKHGTKHNEYICYECGYKNDRDTNAMLNLTYLATHPELNRAL